MFPFLLFLLPLQCDAFYWVKNDPMNARYCPIGSFAQGTINVLQPVSSNDFKFSTQCLQYDSANPFITMETTITQEVFKNHTRDENEGFYYSYLYITNRNFVLDDHGKTRRYKDSPVYLKMSRFPFCPWDSQPVKLFKEYDTTDITDENWKEVALQQFKVTDVSAECHTFYEYSVYGPNDSPHPVKMGGILGITSAFFAIPTIGSLLVMLLVKDISYKSVYQKDPKSSYQKDTNKPTKCSYKFT